MGEQFNYSGSPSGFQFDNNLKGKQPSNDNNRKLKEDKDLIIEENTVYEIDRDCYERLRRQRRRRAQEKRNI